MEVVWALSQRRAEVEPKDKAGCLSPVLPGHPRMSLSCSLNMASTLWTIGVILLTSTSPLRLSFKLMARRSSIERRFAIQPASQNLNV
jgi:hypothetical protein